MWRYLFYRHYKISLSFNSIDPEFGSTLGMALIFWLNLWTIFDLISLIINHPIIVVNKTIGISMLIVSALIQYYLFFWKQKYRDIVKEFSGIDNVKKESYLDYVITISVLVISVSLWVYFDSTFTELFLNAK